MSAGKGWMTRAISRRATGQRLQCATALVVLAALTPCGAAEELANPANVTPAYPSLHILGFSDAGFSATDADSALSNSGFYLGPFVLHFTSSLSSRIAFFGEVSLTTNAERGYGVGDDALHPNAEVHRSFLKYTHGDAVKLSIGRFHTPVSYWNVAFHHGAWLQTTVTRPKMLDFTSSFLPLHFIGAFAEGDLPTGSLNLQYSAGIGNGRGSGPGRAEAPADVNDNRAWTVRLGAKPDALHGLEVGGAHYADQYDPHGEGYRERIWNAYAAFTRERPEVLAEYVSVRHREIGDPGTVTSWAFYVQAAYRVKALEDKLKPYARWEEMRLREAEVCADGCRSGLVGLRVDVSEFAAFKLEYQRHSSGGAPFRNGLLSQVSFTF
jgi:hypothetical protein